VDWIYLALNKDQWHAVAKIADYWIFQFYEMLEILRPAK
jgi:hypothetical protein